MESPEEMRSADFDENSWSESTPLEYAQTLQRNFTEVKRISFTRGKLFKRWNFILNNY